MPRRADSPNSSTDAPHQRLTLTTWYHPAPLSPSTSAHTSSIAHPFWVFHSKGRIHMSVWLREQRRGGCELGLPSCDRGERDYDEEGCSLWKRYEQVIYYWVWQIHLRYQISIRCPPMDLQVCCWFHFRHHHLGWSAKWYAENMKNVVFAMRFFFSIAYCTISTNSSVTGHRGPRNEHICTGCCGRQASVVNILIIREAQGNSVRNWKHRNLKEWRRPRWWEYLENLNQCVCVQRGNGADANPQAIGSSLHFKGADRIVELDGRNWLSSGM